MEGQRHHDVTSAPIILGFAGTAWSKKFLEAMDEAPYRRWAARIVTSIAGYYVLYRGYLAVTT
jgi:hypothetical protein